MKRKREQIEIILKKDEETEVDSNSDSNSTSSVSTLSDAVEVNAKKNKIFVSATVTDDNEIELQLSPASIRPDTLLKGQGDHITSYIAIITAIFFSANKNTIVDAISKMKTFIAEMSPEGHKIPEMFTGKPLYAKDDRKTTVKKLRKGQTIFKSIENTNLDLLSPELSKKLELIKSLKYSNDDIKRINGALKRDKLRSLAASLEKLVSYALESIQSAEMTTIFSRGRVNKAKNEGSLAKEAARALIALNRLCQMTSFNDEELNKNLNGFKSSLLMNEGRKNNSDKHIMRYGLSHFIPDIDSFSDALEEAKNDPAKIRAILGKEKNAILDKPSLIAEKIGDLYDYKQQLKFDLAKALPNFPAYAPNYYKPHMKALKKLLGKDVQANSDIRFEKKIFVKNNKKMKVIYATIHRQDMPFLIRTILKHFAVIETAFSFLKADKDRYDKIKTAFLEDEVLQKSGWSNIFTLKDLNIQFDEAIKIKNNYDDGKLSIDFSHATDDENEDSENDKNRESSPRDIKKTSNDIKKKSVIKGNEISIANHPFSFHKVSDKKTLKSDIFNNNPISDSMQPQKLIKTPGKSTEAIMTTKLYY